MNRHLGDNNLPVEFGEEYSSVLAGLFSGGSQPMDDCTYHNVANCPDCGAGMVRLGTCMSCPLCGFGSCS